jgi:hypothetical protein
LGAARFAAGRRAVDFAGAALRAAGFLARAERAAAARRAAADKLLLRRVLALALARLDVARDFTGAARLVFDFAAADLRDLDRFAVAMCLP